MYKILPLKDEAFGLDINDLSLKIAKLKKKRNGFVLVSFNEKRIAPGIIEDGVVKDEEALVKIIKSACETVKGKKLETKYVVASLPEEKSFLQVIQMPIMSQNELRLAVPLEAENYIPLPIEEVYLDFQIIPPAKNYFDRLEVLIVAMPKKIVNSYVSCLKRAGLVPIILEAESEAIARALVKKETNSSLLILVDFGENNTDFIVFSGQSIRFTCPISVSSQLLTRVIAESLKVDFAEAEKMKINYGLTDQNISQAMTPILNDLTAQIKKYVSFYRDHSSYEYLLENGKTEKIILCGGGAKLKGLTEFLSKKLETPVELGDPISYTTAIGLALRQIDNK